MKISELEKYLNKNVTVTLKHKKVYSGELEKSDYFRKHYTVKDSHMHFRCSHVAKLKEIN